MPSKRDKPVRVKGWVGYVPELHSVVFYIHKNHCAKYETQALSATLTIDPPRRKRGKAK